MGIGRGDIARWEGKCSQLPWVCVRRPSLFHTDARVAPSHHVNRRPLNSSKNRRPLHLREETWRHRKMLSRRTR